ncbi:MAG: hypothetical protein AAF211_17460, partial [Myxococcota bacterium]
NVYGECASMSEKSGESILGAPPGLVVGLILVLLVRLVDRSGLGNGFAIFVLLDAWQQLSWIIWGPFTEQDLSPFVLLLVLVLLGIRFARPPLILWGLVQPLGVAIALATTPPTRFTLEPGTMGLQIAGGLGAIALVAWLSRLPPLVASLGSTEGKVDAKRLRTARRTVLQSTVAIVVILGIVAPVLATSEVVEPILAPASYPIALLAIAIVVDLGDELRWRAKGEGPWVAVWPLHQPYRVGPAIAALKRAEIPHFLRSLRYRSLVGPFDPRVPIDVMVPESRQTEAAKILDETLVLRPSPEE